MDLAADSRMRPTELAPNRTQRQTLNPSRRNELPLLETKTLPRHPHHLRSSHQSTGAMTGRIQGSVSSVQPEASISAGGEGDRGDGQGGTAAEHAVDGLDQLLDIDQRPGEQPPRRPDRMQLTRKVPVPGVGEPGGRL